ncbi:hypothetical protein GN244_ATG12999 [Phytophthora infestans]|uniref:Uncharacterized protein n=1 Tax=Phytophthora infestans TaxID=4787 RepID=A0A833W9V5_PHYIN|nr:hypothetical protein GN244_ATG12999 [Phytophthora infestans]
MGIALQSQAQREAFGRYSDTLAVDWIYNCTNIRFYVGSIVATLPTGQGVSVLDFLCLNQ